MNPKITTGKLPVKLLKKLIKKLPTKDKHLLIPPGVGLDAAGLKIGSKTVAITTDPITFTTDQIGTYSVAVNINDVACLGCRPRWYSATLLLPPGINEPQIAKIWHDLALALQQYNICAIGGHCEITPAVNIPVIVGQMIGEMIGNSLLDVRNIKAGDKILLWRAIAIEGSAIIAKNLAHKLTKQISKTKLYKMQNLLHDPGICVWPLVEKLVPEKGLVALHDPTEGGLATALHEMADACGCGLSINADKIPILAETSQLAKILKFDSLGLLASGSLIIVCRPSALFKIKRKLSTEPITEIGEFTKKPAHQIIVSGKRKPLPTFKHDEIIDILNKAKS